MSRLTATQLTILVAACAHDEGLAIRPDTLKPSAAAKLVAKLTEQGLLRELRAKGNMPVWREDEHGKAFSLKILKAGRTAVQAMAPPTNKAEGLTADSSNEADGALMRSATELMPLANAIIAKPGSKRALLLALLSCEDGVTITAIMAATGWLPHSTRAALSGLRKSGLAIARCRDEEGGASVYRIVTTTEAAAA